MKYIFDNILVITLMCMLFGCTTNDEVAPISNKTRLEIIPTLSGSPLSRASIDPNDGCSYLKFENNDICGFFSEHRESVTDNGYANEPMKYANGVFVSDQMVDMNVLGRTFLYYPYDARITEGIDVRKPDGSVIDLLAGNDGHYVPNQGYSVIFYHAFSMLIIKGGIGFEQVTGEGKDITVTIDRPIKQVKIPDSKENGLFERFEFLPAEGGSPEDAQFKGVYKGIYKDPKTQQEVPAWFIIIPSGNVNVKVKSITTTDDLNRKQIINIPDNLIEYGAGLQAGKRYPLTLKMDEQVPTINIDNIEPWIGDVINIATSTGINSVMPPVSAGDENDFSFRTWAATYKSYIEGMPGTEEVLKRFGYRDEQRVWHFTINVDLDFSYYEAADGVNFGQAISELKDELDCKGHTLSNLTLKNTDAAAFIGEVCEGGKLSNVRLNNFSVVGGSRPSGLVATVISGGTIENCTVENMTVECNSSVGALAGQMTGGTARNCHFAGNIIGSGTANAPYARVVGTYNGGTLTDMDVTNVLYGRK